MSGKSGKNGAGKSVDATVVDTAGVNLLVDGSFEQAAIGAGKWSTFASVGGWQSDTGVEIWGKNFITKASDGDKVMELDADKRDSRVWQDVKTEAGAEYTFSFDYAQRPDTKAATNTIEVWWNGEMVGRVEPGSTAWAQASFTVKGTGGTDRIEFREEKGDNDSYGGVIDNASLVRVPDAVVADDNDKRNNDDDKHDGRDHGDGDHNDDGHTDNGRDVEGKGKDEDQSGRGKDPNNDDDKHDGRGHGDGDHNDDGHTDNGQGGHGHGDDHDDDDHDDHGGDDTVSGGGDDTVSGGGDDAPDGEDPVGEPTRTISLVAKDVDGAASGQQMTGSRGEDAMSGGQGDDHLMGRSGDDVLNGDAIGVFTAPLDISASLSDGSGAEGIEVTIAGVPKGATLSAGRDNGDGTWSLTGAELAGLSITSPDDLDFKLHVTAIAADGSALLAETDLKVTIAAGSDDVIEGGRGNDEINGDAGNDLIFGGSKPTGQSTTTEPQPGDDDTIRAGDGDDQVWAGSGNDMVWGETGNDWISGGRGNDMLSGGDGDDVVLGNSGDDMIWGDAGNDDVTGGSGNDSIWGGDGDDVLRGGSGDDTFYTDAGADAIMGGSGFDTLVLSSHAGDTNTYVTDLSQGFVGNAEVGYDTLSSIEAVIGGYGNDLMHGTTKANMLVGGGGDDVLRGAAGMDTLTGGEGYDTFVFLGKDVAKLGGDSLGVDLITDLEVGDVVDVSDVVRTRNASLQLVDDGESSMLMATFKGHTVEIAKLEGFSGVTLEEMIEQGMLIV